MKSALELAMEKADGLLDKDYVKLNPEQIKAIDEIKKQYEAKWAEKEIEIKGRLERAAKEMDPQAFAESSRLVHEETQRLREQLFAERDSKIEAIRQSRE